MRDGFSRFAVDGRTVPSFVYKVSGRDGAQYSGKPLQRHGVKIGCIALTLGELPGRPAPWNESGFDVRRAVDKIRAGMTIGDESLFILSLGCSAYPAFTEVEHPDETWRREDGSVVRGANRKSGIDHRSARTWNVVSYTPHGENSGRIEEGIDRKDASRRDRSRKVRREFSERACTSAALCGCA